MGHQIRGADNQPSQNETRDEQPARAAAPDVRREYRTHTDDEVETFLARLGGYAGLAD
jgi:hypothetical protein